MHLWHGNKFGMNLSIVTIFAWRAFALWPCLGGHRPEFSRKTPVLIVENNEQHKKRGPNHESHHLDRHSAADTLLLRSWRLGPRLGTLGAQSVMRDKTNWWTPKHCGRPACQHKPCKPQGIKASLNRCAWGFKHLFLETELLSQLQWST